MSLAPGRTYRYFTGTPLYPFGWGLSYTTFDLEFTNGAPATSFLNISNTNLTSVTVSLTNTGDVTGDEVIQCYFSPNGAVPPSELASLLLKEMFDFQRITLTPGEKAELIVSFSADTFITYDASGDQVIYPGAYTVFITNGVSLVRMCPLLYKHLVPSHPLADPDGRC